MRTHLMRKHRISDGDANASDENSRTASDGEAEDWTNKSISRSRIENKID